MIGRKLEFSRSHAVPIICWSILTIVSFAFAVTLKNDHWLVFAFAPFFVTLAYILKRGSAQTVEVMESGLRILPEDEYIAYSEIEALRINGVSVSASGNVPAGRLEVVSGGKAYVLERNGETAEIYRWLCEKAETTGSREVPEKLRKFLDDQLQKFDADLVSTYVSRKGETCAGRKFGGFGLGLTFGGAAWFVGGILMKVDEGIPWIVFGSLMLFLLLMIRIAMSLSSSFRPLGIKDTSGCGLIVSPFGLALVQGDMSGRLRWDEIRKVTLIGSHSFRIANVGNILTLNVDGARIQIADLYDRPLSEIHRVIMGYWAPEE